MKKVSSIAVLLTIIFATSSAIAANGNTGLFQMWDYENINPSNSRIALNYIDLEMDCQAGNRVESQNENFYY